MKCMCCLIGSEDFRADMRRRAKGPNSISKIDNVSRFLFPLAFVVFNAIYWHIYTLTDDDIKLWTDDFNQSLGNINVDVVDVVGDPKCWPTPCK